MEALESRLLLSKVDFDVPISIPAGGALQALATADLNGDEILDLAVASHDGRLAGYTSRVQMLLGNGDGTFRESASTTFGGAVQRLLPADLNYGRMAIVVQTAGGFAVIAAPDRIGGSLVLYQHPPFGTEVLAAAEPTSREDAGIFIRTGGSRMSVMVSNPFRGVNLPFEDQSPSWWAGDLNGDDENDLVSGDSNGLRIRFTVLRDPYAPELSVPTPIRVDDLRAADFDGDGRLDFLITDRTRNAVVMLRNGDTGSFSPGLVYEVGDVVQEVIAADFNADGRPDVGLLLADRIKVLVNEGGGAFVWTSVDLPSRDGGLLAAGDFNRDGRIDLAIANPITNSVLVLSNRGDGRFVPPAVPGASDTPGWTSVDVNNDGRPDRVSLNPDDSSIVVRLDMKDGSVTQKVTAGESFVALAIADFNGDGHVDAATIVHNAPSAPVLKLLSGDGTGTFTLDPALAGAPAYAAVRALTAVDMNLDGKPDLVVQYASANVASVFLNLGGGRFAPRADHVLAGAAEQLLIQDLDRDSKPDLVAFCPAAQSIDVLLSDGSGGYTRNGYYAPLFDPFIIADIDGDGWRDLVQSDEAGDRWRVWLNTGSGEFGDYTTGGDPAIPNILWGDFNGDGRQDYLAINESVSEFVSLTNVHLAKADGSFTSAPFWWQDFSDNWLVAADFSGDGKTDLGAWSEATRTFTVLRGNSGGSFEAPVQYHPGNSEITDILIGDVNADGQPDVTLVGQRLCILLNAPKAAAFDVTQLPQWVRAGDPFFVSVTVLDRHGQPIPDDTSPVTLSRVDGRGSIEGAATAWAKNGVAVFGPLSITAADIYSLRVSGKAASTLSRQFMVLPGPAAKLAFKPEPVDGDANQLLTGIEILRMDRYGNTSHETEPEITLWMMKGDSPRVRLYPDFTGYFGWGECEAGSYRLFATADGLEPASATFRLTSSAAALEFEYQPRDGVLGAPVSAVITVNDAQGSQLYGEIVHVTLSIESGPPGAVLGGTVTLATQRGIAFFSDLLLTTPGTYVLRATAGDLPVAMSRSFTLHKPNTAPLLIKEPAAPVRSEASAVTQLLQVDAEDDEGEQNLTYTWAATARPDGATVTYPAENGTNAGKSLLVGFDKPGTYTFEVTVQDAGGLSTKGSVTFTVTRRVAAMTISPANTTVQAGATQAFIAAAVDQFGQAMSISPWWSVRGAVEGEAYNVGTISSDGIFFAGPRNGRGEILASYVGPGGATLTSKVEIVVTGGAPAVPWGLALTSRSATSVGFTWTLGENGEETGVYVMRWNGQAWFPVAVLPRGSTSYVDYGLSPLRTYVYNVMPFNAKGQSLCPVHLTATTTSPAPPAAPTGLTATALAAGAVKVDWTPGGGETAVAVKRWNGSTWLTVAQLPAGSWTYTETGLTPGTQYYYHVAALSGYGATWAATYVGVRTWPAAAPARAMGLGFAQVSATSGRISWTLNGGGETVVYVAKWSGTRWQVIAALPAGSTGFVDPGLWKGAKFHYMVITANAFGQAWAASYVTGQIV